MSDMGIERNPNPYEVYNLPMEKIKEKIPSNWRHYNIEKLFDYIIDHYIEDEEEKIKALFEAYAPGSRTELRNQLKERIHELNEMPPNNYSISRNTRSIKIPSNLDFFKMVFPDFRLMMNTVTKISTEIGVLQELNYSLTLEQVFRGTRQPDGIDSTGIMEVNTALDRMKIYSCSNENQGKKTDATVEGIKIFQKEYIDNVRNQPIVEVKYKNGELDGSTLHEMHLALKHGWTRELYFYYKAEGKEHYVHDFVINNKDFVNTDTEIFAQERGQRTETSLGEKVQYRPLGGRTRYGIERFASRPYLYEINPTNTSTQKVIGAIAKVEGSVGGKNDHGGYNAINAYDGVALSVGLFHWNVDWLWWLLYNYRDSNKQNYDTYIQKYGLGIDGSSSNKLFLVDGIAHQVHPDHVEPLRKLKFVYSFVKAAEDPVFQDVQIKVASDWLNLVIGYTVRDRAIKDYITSEHGLALVLDISVLKGRSSDSIQRAVNIAIGEILSSGIADTPAIWDDAVESRLINALSASRKRTDIMGQSDAESREAKIYNAGLRSGRRSFR